MGALTQDIPKAMIPLLGAPAVEHVLRRLVMAGISEFVIVTRYLAERIESYLGDGSRLNASIRYVRQSDKYGTGQALLETREAVGDQTLMMTYGDILTPACNYSGALAVFDQTGTDAVVTLNEVPDPCRGGAVQVGEDGRVTGIIEKPPAGVVPSHWNSSGILVFKPIIFDYLERIGLSPRGELELPDAVNLMIADGLRVQPYYLRGPWIDVGRPEDIPEAERMLNEDSFDGACDS